MSREEKTGKWVKIRDDNRAGVQEKIYKRESRTTGRRENERKGLVQRGKF